MLTHDPQWLILGAAILLGAGLLALAATVPVRRRSQPYTPLRADRQPQEPPSPAGNWWYGSVVLGGTPVRDLPVRPVPGDTDRPGRHRPEPDLHRGATEDWSPVATTNAAGQSDDMLTPAQQMAADHDALAGVTAAVVAFGARIDALLDAFLADDPETRLRVAAYGPSTLGQTGQFDRAELEALLAADDLAVAR
jgi:hypothetical protein